MKRTHRLVVQSALLGSILLSVFGFLVVPAKATKPPAPAPGAMGGEGKRVAVSSLPGEGRKPGEPFACPLDRRLPAEVYRWCELITEHAERNGVAPDLVAAVVYLESGGDPLAYSRSGAVGLMQVMPRDGLAAEFECVNGPCFASRPTRKELEDPAFNVAYGTQMLSALIEKYQNVRAALKAYGPMDVGYTYADKVMAIWDRYSAE